MAHGRVATSAFAEQGSDYGAKTLGTATRGAGEGSGLIRLGRPSAPGRLTETIRRAGVMGFVDHAKVGASMQSESRLALNKLPTGRHVRFDASDVLAERLAEPRSFAPRSGDAKFASLRDLPASATLRDVVERVLGEWPRGHSQTFANVVLLQRALLRLAEAAAGRPFGEWEPEP